MCSVDMFIFMQIKLISYERFWNKNKLENGLFVVFEKLKAECLFTPNFMRKITY